MNDLWTALEEYSRAWAPVDRQSLADTIWGGYVTARFGRTGDTRAFDYLYPYLNHADRVTQLRAIRVVGSVFEGSGQNYMKPCAKKSGSLAISGISDTQTLPTS